MRDKWISILKGSSVRNSKFLKLPRGKRHWRALLRKVRTFSNTKTPTTRHSFPVFGVLLGRRRFRILKPANSTILRKVGYYDLESTSTIFPARTTVPLPARIAGVH